MSALPLRTKLYEKMLYKQLNLFIETKLSHHLYGLPPKYSTQYALSNLLFNWQKYLNKSRIVSTIRMYLSKAFNCLPRHLIISKIMLMV